MRDHLRPLIGKCTGLKELTLRTAWQDFYSDWMWSESHDEARYREWAGFIESVRPTLQYLDFDQGIPPQFHNQSGCGRHDPLPLQKKRPMHQRFITFILPLLVKGPYPVFKGLIIRGGWWNRSRSQPLVFRS